MAEYIVIRVEFHVFSLPFIKSFLICLLYTSDAADEARSGDLGGRRIIKKKKKLTRCYRRAVNYSVQLGSVARCNQYTLLPL
ncbi:hypothetical protein PVA38_09300 [Streptococcus pneumoniae D39]|nr:hypothetical protein PVA38_09300 [Streptococcus pneumoniae D39]